MTHVRHYAVSGQTFDFTVAPEAFIGKAPPWPCRLAFWGSNKLAEHPLVLIRFAGSHNNLFGLGVYEEVVQPEVRKLCKVQQVWLWTNFKFAKQAAGSESISTHILKHQSPKSVCHRHLDGFR